MRVVRGLLAVVAGVACVTCFDDTVSGVRGAGYAIVPLQPLFVQAPQGGPSIPVNRIRGVLRGSTDSAVAEANVEGDSAILEFTKVVVRGDSTKYELGVQAFDQNNVLVFEGEEDLQIKPGDNKPATPVLDYAAPDTSVTSIDISVTALTLDWAGAAVGNTTCLNRVPNASALTQQKLTITGKNAGNQVVPNVRVGWTSRDTAAFTVDTAGLVKARCGNKSAYLVARTFLNKVDSILVTVNAPPFSLLMKPDSISLPRGKTQLFTAVVVDEVNDTLPAATVSWASSDTLRARVSATGLVAAIANGRVLITASSGNRTTVGVVQVVRPPAFKVVLLPATTLDSLAKGQTRAYFAKALDSLNRVIGDATGFQWSTDNSAIATVNATTGLLTAVDIGETRVKVTLDGKRDSVRIAVLTALAPGTIKSTVIDAATGSPLAGVDVRTSSTNVTTSAADGSFTLGGLQGGENLTVSRTGYVTIVAYSLPSFPGKTIQIPNVPMSPTSTSTGVMTGKVVSVLSNSGVAGISVSAYAGINAGPSPARPNVTPDATATTGSDGTYSLTAPAGVYTLLIKGTGYSDVASVANAVGGETRTFGDVLLPPTAPAGGLFIVLTWAPCGAGNVPCDLDAHLTGPKVSPDTGRFQVFSGNTSYVASGDTVVKLDVAASNGRGPEVLGLRPSAPAGLYRFYVHNKSAGTTATSTALADSSFARVDVYQDNHVVATFFPPRNVAGTVWNVFEYDGARFFPIGTITNPADPNVLALRAAPAVLPAAVRR